MFGYRLNQINEQDGFNGIFCVQDVKAVKKLNDKISFIHTLEKKSFFSKILKFLFTK
jgi:hypothetical protein